METEIESSEEDILPEVITPAVEQMYWLSQNEKFASEVKNLREKWGISVSGGESNHRFLKRKNLQENMNFYKDILLLFNRCSLSSTNLVADFLFMLGQYVTTGKIRSFRDDGKLIGGWHPIDVKYNEERKIFEIKGDIAIDATKSHFKKLVDAIFIKVRAKQKELGVKKRKGAVKEKSFYLSTKIYAIYERLVNDGCPDPIKKIYGWCLDEKDFDVFKNKEDTEFPAVKERINEAKKKIEKAFT